MSTILTGNPANVTSPLSATILSATSGGGVITCTTSANHLFGNGDYALITGGTGLTAINGWWQITVTGSATFTIPTTGAGSYGASSATAVDKAFTPQVQVTSDGDAAAMQASMLSTIQLMLDRSQWIKTHGLLSDVAHDSVTGSWTSSSLVAGSAVAVATIYALVGDVIDVSSFGSIAISATGGFSYPGEVAAGITMSYSENGGAQTAFGGTSGLAAYLPSASYNGPQCSLSSGGCRIVAAAGPFIVAINGLVGGSNQQASANGTVVVRQYRP